MLKFRTKNCALITNGVDPAHWNNLIINHRYLPKVIVECLRQQKKIIGYFGALATWFDYELVIKVAKHFTDCIFLLLGWDYDGSLKKSKIELLDNVIVLGPIEYKILPYYAKTFSVSILPFLLNDITESTSPVKLFEYMMLDKPILTTALPECKKYKSVNIAYSAEEFINKLQYLLTNGLNQEQKAVMRAEAEQNTWVNKAKLLKELIH